MSKHAVPAVNPRELIAEYYSSSEGILPIAGGWGLAKEDVCVIDKHDPVATPGFEFDAWKVINTFVETRLYLELISSRAEGDRYNDIHWALIGRETVEEDGRVYEHQGYEVSALHDRDWESLKAEWDGPNGFNSQNFDREDHLKRREELTVTTQNEFWFDVTSCFRQSLFEANLPWFLAGFARHCITDYEIQQPGLGYSVAYNMLSGDGTATVYFYSNGEESIPDDPEEESFVEYFRGLLSQVIAGIEQQGRTCEFISAKPIRRTEGIAEYLVAEFMQNSDQDGHKRTYLFLRSYRGQYLKLRITVPADDQYRAMPMNFAAGFMDALEAS